MLIIQLPVDMFALCANQTGVASPAAASWPDDVEQGWSVELKISSEWRFQEGEQQRK